MLLFPFGTDREITNSGWVTVLVASVWIGLFATFKYLEKPINDYIPESVKNVTNQLGASAQSSHVEYDSAPTEAKEASSPEIPALVTEDLGFSSPHTRAADDVFSKFEFDPSKNWMPSILTHGFIHRNWLPFIGNVLFLLAFGVAIERWYGAPIYGVFLFCAAALAAASQVIMLNHFLGSWPGQAIHGGSGILAGIVGAFLRTQWRQRVKIVGAFWVTTRNYFLPAWLFALAWMVYQGFETAWSWSTTSPMVISAYFLTIAFGFGVASFLPSPYREEMVSEHRGAHIHLPPEIRIANTPLEQQQTNSAAISGIRRGLAAPPPPSGLHMPPQMPQSSGYHDSIRPAIDLAWRALESDSQDEARNEFSRQFSQWIKDGLSGYESLIRNLDMLRSRYPDFCLHTAMAYELGLYMRKNNEWGLCHYCLKQTLQSDPPLSEALCDKRDSMLLEMEEQMRQSRERNEMLRKNRQAMIVSSRDEFEVTGDMLSVFTPDAEVKPVKKPPTAPTAPEPNLQQGWLALKEERYSDARRMFRICLPRLMKEDRTGFSKILQALERLRVEYPEFRLSLQTALELGIYLTQRNEWELALYCLNQTIPVEHRLSESLRNKRDQAMVQLSKKMNRKKPKLK